MAHFTFELTRCAEFGGFLHYCIIVSDQLAVDSYGQSCGQYTCEVKWYYLYIYVEIKSL